MRLRPLRVAIWRDYFLKVDDLLPVCKNPSLEGLVVLEVGVIDIVKGFRELFGVFVMVVEWILALRLNVDTKRLFKLFLLQFKIRPRL